MIDFKAIAGGFAIAATVALAPLAIGTGTAVAAPDQQGPSVQGASQDDGGSRGVTGPSPYAVYGGSSLCAAPGMYFVNICA